MRRYALPFALLFEGAFHVGIGKIQYKHGSSASPCVTGLLLKGVVALITSRREVRRRSSFRELSPALYKGPPRHKAQTRFCTRRVATFRERTIQVWVAHGKQGPQKVKILKNELRVVLECKIAQVRKVIKRRLSSF